MFTPSMIRIALAFSSLSKSENEKKKMKNEKCLFSNTQEFYTGIIT